MTTHIYAHNPGSAGARELAQALGIRRVRAKGSAYRRAPNKTVINWGSSRLPDHVVGSRIINRPEAVANVTDKLRFFNLVRDNKRPRVPEFTTDRNLVRAWLQDGHKVVVRHTLQGHSGAGIEVLEGAGVDIPTAPLYTKYVPKKEEWRIHVMRLDGELTIIDQQRKIRDPDFDGVPDWNVRSHANGFIFARNVDPAHPDVMTQALAALDVSGLDFGAVDVIYNHQQGQAYVLEINSAPGLVGTTIQSYADALRRFVV